MVDDREGDIMSFIRNLRPSEQSPQQKEKVKKWLEECEEDRKAQRERVRGREKREVTASLLSQIMTCSRFKDNLREIFRGITGDILTSVIGNKRGVRERGFIVYKRYDSDDCQITEVAKGSLDRIAMGELTVNDWDVFELINLHCEVVSDRDERLRRPFVPSVIDGDDMRGDLTTLRNIRAKYQELGVDVKPVMIVLFAGVGTGRMMLIQESGQIHSFEQLFNLEQRLGGLAWQGARQKEYERALKEAGYNLWSSPIKTEFAEDELRNLEQFEFTPENL